MTSPLAPWGVDEDAETVYRAALRQPGRTPQEVAAALGRPSSEVAQALRLLASLGLVSMDDARRVLPRPPVHALGALLAREQQRMAYRQRELSNARLAVDTYAVEHLAGVGSRRIEYSIEVVPADETLALTERLTEQSVGTIKVFLHPSSWPRVVLPGVRELNRQVLGSGRQFHTIFDSQLLGEPLGLEIAQEWLALGDRIRVAPDLPARLVLFGEDASLVSLPWGSPGDIDAVIQQPEIVRVLSWAFERVWEAARPLPVMGRAEQDIDRDRRRVLELLALGAKDEAIARHLGVSLRTARRRVADVFDELGATTRFQAGVEAARRGWV
jgi:DNA-binding CsgD family transcriptional regulator